MWWPPPWYAWSWRICCSPFPIARSPCPSSRWALEYPEELLWHLGTQFGGLQHILSSVQELRRCLNWQQLSLSASGSAQLLPLMAMAASWLLAAQKVRSCNSWDSLSPDREHLKPCPWSCLSYCPFLLLWFCLSVHVDSVNLWQLWGSLIDFVIDLDLLASCPNLPILPTQISVLVVATHLGRQLLGALLVLYCDELQLTNESDTLRTSLPLSCLSSGNWCTAREKDPGSSFCFVSWFRIESLSRMLGPWNGVLQFSRKGVVEPKGRERSPFCSANATCAVPMHVDGANAASGWNSAMEFCRKSKPTIKMRKSSRNEHINNQSRSKLLTPGKVQFSVKNKMVSVLLTVQTVSK